MTDEWIAILTKLKEEIGDSIDFFRATEGELKDNCLHVKTATAFSRKFISDSFTEALKRASGADSISVMLKREPVYEDAVEAKIETQPEFQPRIEKPRKIVKLPELPKSKSEKTYTFTKNSVIVAEKPKPSNLDSVIEDVAKCFGISSQAILNAKSTYSRIAMYVAIKRAKKECSETVREIADKFNVSPDTVYKQIVKIKPTYHDVRFVLVKKIIKLVCKQFHILEGELHSRIRSHSIKQVRHLAIYITRYVTGLSYPQIGKQFDRDHTTIMSSIQKAEALMQQDSQIREIVSTIIEEIKNDKDQ